MMTRSLNIVLFFVSLILFALFQRIELHNIASLALAENVTSSSYSFYVLFLFLCSSLFVYINRAYIKRTEAKHLKRFCLWIYIISLFFSVLYPFGTKIMYILIVIPYILFLFMYISYDLINVKLLWGGILSLFIYLVYGYCQEYINVVAFSFSDDAVTNASYFILYLLPLLLCIDKKVVGLFALLITIVVVVSSSKRGGTIAVILAGLTYFIVEYLFVQKKISTGLVLFVVCIFFLIRYGYDNAQELTVFGRIEGIADDEGSGRLDIFQHILSMIGNSSILNFLYGHGWNSVIRDSSFHLSAHNDFLEVTYDFGIIGLILYLLLYYKLIKKTLALIKKKSTYASAMAVSIVLFCVCSFVSHIVIYPFYMSLFCLCWGYIYGADKTRKISGVKK